MSGEIVPFGKYKGRPIEAMAQDQKYVEWLTAQPWFRERFANIYTLIVNNFQEPTETPQHNALQVLFLRKEFCDAFFMFVGEVGHFARTDFELDGFDVRVAACRFQEAVREGQRVNLPVGMIGEGTRVDEYGREWLKYRELRSWDEYWHIEIKPTVGDEYPAVLRQIRNAVQHQNALCRDRMKTGRYDLPEIEHPVLFLEQYIGAGATEEQFIQIFESAGIKVVFLDEVV